MWPGLRADVGPPRTRDRRAVSIDVVVDSAMDADLCLTVAGCERCRGVVVDELGEDVRRAVPRVRDQSPLLSLEFVRRLRIGFDAVLDECHPRLAALAHLKTRAGAIGQAVSEVLGWRAAGERPEVPVKCAWS
jgi:hypothetical protein